MDAKNMEYIPVETDRQIFTVSDITRNLRFTLEQNFSNIWIEGEITNFKSYSSGHMYFTLKDEGAQISCVMFRTENARLTFEPQDGMSVVCFGRISIYPVRGQYQLYVERAEPKGLGALQLRFQELKDRLLKEGLFAEERKRQIPFLPERIAIVTSIDGAALRDILHVIDRRHTGAHLLIYPVQVQGQGAAEQIAQAIEELNQRQLADVMIVGRGGGSLEDLWAFNEEIVARAIFESEIPVISAVGHEVDFTIADFVADLRAATPSAAAELVLPHKEDLLLRLSSLRTRALNCMASQIKQARQELEPLAKSRALKDPLSFFEIQLQRLDELKKNLSQNAAARLSLVRQEMIRLAESLHFRAKTSMQFRKQNLSGLLNHLEALGPLSTLKRGFSVTTGTDGHVITNAAVLKPGDTVRTRLTQGFFTSTVKEITKG